METYLDSTANADWHGKQLYALDVQSICVCVRSLLLLLPSLNDLCLLFGFFFGGEKERN